jgi:hypothetical protein
MDTQITILISSTVIISHIHTFIIRIIFIPMADFRCMGMDLISTSTIAMVITHIMVGGTVTMEVGMGVVKGVGKVGIMETREDMADIKVVDTEVGMVDEAMRIRKD